MGGHECTVVTVDVVIETPSGIVLIRRGREPFKGWWAIPGGIVEPHELVEDAAKREIHEETGLLIDEPRLLGVYSKPDRDPRGRYISIAFYAGLAGGRLRGGDDASVAREFPVEEIPSKLAFDHDKIIRDYLILRESKDGER